MKKVRAYQLSTGEVITDRKVAVEKQRFIDITKELKDFAEEHLIGDAKENFLSKMEESTVRERLANILNGKSLQNKQQ